MRQATRELAKGKWRSILVALGVDADYLTGRHGPCPVCGGKDRFRFDDSLQGGNWICNQCGSGDGFELLMGVRDCTFKEAAMAVDSVVGEADQAPAKPKRDPKPALRRVGNGLERIQGRDPVSLYLKNRGISGIAGYALRTHPALHYYENGRRQGTWPAMVARISNAQGKTESFHITYLTEDGQKAPVEAPRKVMSPVNSINGAAIQLAPVARHIALTEGIENALAVMEGEGLPCWACVSANGIEAFQPPEGVEQLTIYSDNDAKFRGQVAAMTLAHRLSMEGYEVDVFILGQKGDDYLDCLNKARRLAA